MHTNYFQISAKSYHESGGMMGELFTREAKKAIEANKETPEWKGRIETAKRMMEVTQTYFPQYIEEDYLDDDTNFLSYLTLCPHQSLFTRRTY